MNSTSTEGATKSSKLRRAGYTVKTGRGELLRINPKEKARPGAS